MKLLTRSFFLLWALLAGVAVHADAGLRIACEGEIDGAEVLVNGTFKGECPVDIKVPAGVAKVRVSKKLSDGRQLWFYQEFRLADGVLKKVDVWPLSTGVDASTSEMEKKAELGDVKAMRTVAGMYKMYGLFRRDSDNGRKNCEQSLRWSGKVLEVSEDGKTLSDMGDLYTAGCGTEKNEAKAEQFYRQAFPAIRADAEKGDVDAMIALARAYGLGQGVPKDEAEDLKWLRKAKASGSDAASEILKMLGKE